MKPSNNKSNTTTTSSSSSSSSLVVVAIAIFALWCQPSLLTDPVRSTMENAFYFTHALNFLSGSQGTMNWLDRWTLHWMNYNSAHQPPPVGSMKPEKVAFIDASEYNPKSFRNLTKNYRLPLVVRGLFKESKATKTWSIEHFKRVIPDTPVTVLESDPGCYQKMLDVIRTRTRVQTSVCKSQSTFGEYLSNMKGRYVIQMSSHFREKPEMLDELELERLHHEVYDVKQAIAPTMFTGRGTEFPSMASFHCAAAPNFFIQVFGHKIWRILHPKWSPYFQPSYWKDNTPAVTSRNILYDYGTFDQFNATNLPYVEMKLGPGDFLYLPGWWWHEVRHEQDEEFTGVGLRPVRGTAHEFIPGLSNNFAFSMGNSLKYLRALYVLVTGQDWGAHFFEGKK